MSKKAHITINLLPEACGAPVNQIEEKIKNEARIPFCGQIEKVTVEEADDSFDALKKHGISNNVARNILDLYDPK